MILLIGLPEDLILKFCGMISLFIYIIGLECACERHWFQAGSERNMVVPQINAICIRSIVFTLENFGICLAGEMVEKTLGPV